MFLGWYDDTPKKPEAEKLAEAVQRYIEKFGSTPNVCLLNEECTIEVPGLEIKRVHYVPRNHFWVGREAEAGETAAPATAAAAA